MGRRRDWDKIGEVVKKTKELELNYKEGAERFGIDVGVLYEYSRRQKKEFSGGTSSRSLNGSQDVQRAEAVAGKEAQALP